MTEEEKEHTKKTGIYVDLQMLAQRIYHLLYEMPKKDRVVLGDKIFNSCVDSLSYFREAFKNMEQREELKKKFVHEFGKMKELVKNPISTLCSINSYSGIMKIRNERGKLFIFMIKIMCKIYGMVRWDNKRRCFNLMEKYNVKNTYKRRYMRRKWI